MEIEALERAEKECLADSDIRARRRDRAAERRAMVDKQYVAEFARRIRELFRGVRPAGKKIAMHAWDDENHNETIKPTHKLSAEENQFQHVVL